MPEMEISTTSNPARIRSESGRSHCRRSTTRNVKGSLGARTIAGSIGSGRLMFKRATRSSSVITALYRTTSRFPCANHCLAARSQTLSQEKMPGGWISPGLPIEIRERLERKRGIHFRA